MSNDSQAPSAFNLILEGVGYLNRIREVTPRKGPAYLACTLNAMMGEAGAVEYLSIDCRVVGQVAKAAVLQLKADVLAKRKVVVGFRAGDPKPEFYEVPDAQSGEMKPKEGLKARLLQLTFAKVNGERVEIPVVARAETPAAAEAAPLAEA